MHDHAEAEYEDDRLYVERDGAGEEEGVERAVIAEVDEQRIDRVIACLPQPDKDIVDDGAARVGDIERDEPHGDGKDLVRISLDFTYILQIHAGGFDKRPVSW